MRWKQQPKDKRPTYENWCLNEHYDRCVKPSKCYCGCHR